MSRDKDHRSHKARDVGAASGMLRTSHPRPRRQPDPYSDEDEGPYIDKKLEYELELPHKDDTVRPANATIKEERPPRLADHGTTGEQEDGKELATIKAHETDKKVAPHMLLITAATYHLGFTPIHRPQISTFIPSCRNMYMMLIAIADLISSNTNLAEIAPGFTTIGMYCYYGIIYYYQILRAKNQLGRGQLNRIERRVLRSLESIGKPDHWPIASPMIEFVRALGYYQSSNHEYSFVCPTFPNFAGLTQGTAANQGLTHLTEVRGIERIPPLPALIEFLHRMGTGAAHYLPTQGWIPIASPNGALDPNANRFLALTNSGVEAAGLQFRALTLTHGWIEPKDSEFRQGPIQVAAKRATIRRWQVPSALGTYSDLETWTRIKDELHIDWITQLIPTMTALNRFFPGSTNLENIEPTSHIGNLTYIDATTDTPFEAVANQWYVQPSNWTMTYHGYDDTPQGRILASSGIATGVLLKESPDINPAFQLDHRRIGPFFEDNAAAPHTERFEVFRFKGDTSQDPTQRFGEQLASIYDATAGFKD